MCTLSTQQFCTHRLSSDLSGHLLYPWEYHIALAINRTLVLQPHIMIKSPSPSVSSTKEGDLPMTKERDLRDQDVQDIGEIEKIAALTSETQQEVPSPPYSIFTKGEKIWIIFLVSTSSLISPLGGTTFYPAMNILSHVLHITPTMTNISITTYMVSSNQVT
jgi:hypothetical protein